MQFGINAGFQKFGSCTKEWQNIANGAIYKNDFSTDATYEFIKISDTSFSLETNIDGVGTSTSFPSASIIMISDNTVEIPIGSQVRFSYHLELEKGSIDGKTLSLSGDALGDMYEGQNTVEITITKETDWLAFYLGEDQPNTKITVTNIVVEAFICPF